LYTGTESCLACWDKKGQRAHDGCPFRLSLSWPRTADEHPPLTFVFRPLLSFNCRAGTPVSQMSLTQNWILFFQHIRARIHIKNVDSSLITNKKISFAKIEQGHTAMSKEKVFGRRQLKLWRLVKNMVYNLEIKCI